MDWKGKIKIFSRKYVLSENKSGKTNPLNDREFLEFKMHFQEAKNVQNLAMKESQSVTLYKFSEEIKVKKKKKIKNIKLLEQNCAQFCILLLVTSYLVCIVDELNHQHRGLDRVNSDKRHGPQSSNST